MFKGHAAAKQPVSQEITMETSLRANIINLNINTISQNSWNKQSDVASLLATPAEQLNVGGGINIIILI